MNWENSVLLSPVKEFADLRSYLLRDVIDNDQEKTSLTFLKKLSYLDSGKFALNPFVATQKALIFQDFKEESPIMYFLPRFTMSEEVVAQMQEKLEGPKIVFSD